MSLVGEAGVPGDDEEPLYAGERIYNVLHDAISEVLLLRGSANVREGQHSYRWPITQR